MSLTKAYAICAVINLTVLLAHGALTGGSLGVNILGGCLGVILLVALYVERRKLT